MNQRTKSDPNLTKLNVALAAGGLITTLIGAGMPGKEASALAASSPTTTMTETAFDSTTIETIVPVELDLNLEAIPTVAAPTFRSAPLSFGRSSG